MAKKRMIGFTLSELLIALAILGVIATFTIPKVLQAQQSSKFKSIAKEAISSVSAAYEAYKLNNPAGGGTDFDDLTPFLNYVKIDTSSPIDDSYAQTTNNCTGTRPCLLLHNGALLRYNTYTFNNTASTNAINFHVDPDGKVTAGGAAGTDGKSVKFFLYYNGRIRTYGTIFSNTCDSNICYAAADPAEDPPWFGWD